MATRPGPTRRKASDDRHPDGAGGVARTKRSRHAFNADQRAEERESAPITIGGQEFRRRRRTWEVTRGLRKHLRAQERLAMRARRLRRELEEMPGDADEAKVEALEDEIDDLTDESDLVAYEIIGGMLSDDEGKNVSVEFLQQHLDLADAGDLAASLAGAEDDEDPTPTTPSS